MKKSVFTLLAIATAVFTMSSCSQDNGGSSNDLNLTQTSSNNSSSVVSSGNQGSVSTVVTSDSFDFFDITVVRTAGNDTKKLSLTVPSTEGSIKVMKSTSDTFTMTSDAAFSVKATVTPKSNWKEVAAAKGDTKLCFGGNTSFQIPGHSNWGSIGVLTYNAKDLSDENIQQIANSIAIKLQASK